MLSQYDSVFDPKIAEITQFGKQKLSKEDRKIEIGLNVISNNFITNVKDGILKQVSHYIRSNKSNLSKLKSLNISFVPIINNELWNLWEVGFNQGKKDANNEINKIAGFSHEKLVSFAKDDKPITELDRTIARRVITSRGNIWKDKYIEAVANDDTQESNRILETWIRENRNPSNKSGVTKRYKDEFNRYVSEDPKRAEQYGVSIKPSKQPKQKINKADNVNKPDVKPTKTPRQSKVVKPSIENTVVEKTPDVKQPLSKDQVKRIRENRKANADVTESDKSIARDRLNVNRKVKLDPTNPKDNALVIREARRLPQLRQNISDNLNTPLTLPAYKPALDIRTKRQLETNRTVKSGIDLLSTTSFGNNYLVKRNNYIAQVQTKNVLDGFKPSIKSYLDNPLNPTSEEVLIRKLESTLRFDEIKNNPANDNVNLISNILNNSNRVTNPEKRELLAERDRLEAKLALLKEGTAIYNITTKKYEENERKRSKLSDLVNVNNKDRKSLGFKPEDLITEQALKSKLKDNKSIVKDLRGSNLIPRIQRVAITELTHAYNLGRLAEFRNQGIKAVKWVATLETGICSFCEERNGIIVSIDDVLDSAGRFKTGLAIAAHPNCFPAGTQILMGDNSNKNIEDIVINDVVAVKTNTVESAKVYDVFKRRYKGTLVKLTLENGTILQTTPDHPIWGGEYFHPASVFKQGEFVYVFTALGNSESDISKICNNRFKIKKINHCKISSNENIKSFKTTLGIREKTLSFIKQYLLHSRFLSAESRSTNRNKRLRIGERYDKVKTVSRRISQFENSSYRQEEVSIPVEGFQALTKLRVIKYEEVPHDDYLYNFSVEDKEVYFANNVLVHNCRCYYTPIKNVDDDVLKSQSILANASNIVGSIMTGTSAVVTTVALYQAFRAYMIEQEIKRQEEVADKAKIVTIVVGSLLIPIVALGIVNSIRTNFATVNRIVKNPAIASNNEIVETFVPDVANIILGTKVEQIEEQIVGLEQQEQTPVVENQIQQLQQQQLEAENSVIKVSPVQIPINLKESELDLVTVENVSISNKTKFAISNSETLEEVINIIQSDPNIPINKQQEIIRTISERNRQNRYKTVKKDLEKIESQIHSTLTVDEISDRLNKIQQSIEIDSKDLTTLNSRLGDIVSLANVIEGTERGFAHPSVVSLLTDPNYKPILKVIVKILNPPGKERLNELINSVSRRVKTLRSSNYINNKLRILFRDSVLEIDGLLYDALKFLIEDLEDYKIQLTSWRIKKDITLSQKQRIDFLIAKINKDLNGEKLKLIQSRIVKIGHINVEDYRLKLDLIKRKLGIPTNNKSNFNLRSDIANKLANFSQLYKVGKKEGNGFLVNFRKRF